MITNHRIPRMVSLKQLFPRRSPFDLPTAIESELKPLLSGVKPGARIAVTVGSRGITALAQIVQVTLGCLRQAGASPFVIPAMGSHGAGTPEGQVEILKEYGVGVDQKTEIQPSMDVEVIGKALETVDVYFSKVALQSDGIVVLNRIKPHTDFRGQLGSGLLKMMVVGLGKRIGAANFHAAALRFGYEKTIRAMAREILRKAPILAGLGVLEDEHHQPAKVAGLRPDEFERREDALFLEARAMMPRLPFPEADLLIVDRLGKNISGSGMDPNIIGRFVHGSENGFGTGTDPLNLRRILVRDLTPETHGNAVGIGLADFTTSRVVRSIDQEKTYINALTALTPQSIKIPPHFETDREAIIQALQSLGMSDFQQARIVRIRDTLNLTEVEVSEAYLHEVEPRKDLAIISPPHELSFNSAGNLN